MVINVLSSSRRALNVARNRCARQGLLVRTPLQQYPCRKHDGQAADRNESERHAEAGEAAGDAGQREFGGAGGGGQRVVVAERECECELGGV